jgi:general secretion pathway protein D
VVPPGLPAQLHGEIQIVPDEATNSLLVRARPDDWEVLRQTIAAMDLRPLQVLIEVVIAEVRRTRDLTVGVSGTISGKGGSAELEGATGGDFTLKVARTGEIDINVTLSAMAANGEVRILSRPVLLAQNNQEARILIGAERPFVQVYRALPTDAAVRDQVVQYRDVGTSLSIVPTINEEGYVNLQVAQEVSTATSETQFGAPVISTREASTHLFIRDGHTAVLGGLIDRQDSRSRSGVPLLKDIPLVGMLFGTTQRNFSQSELFLFITPHVITSDDDTARLRGDLQRGTELLRDTTVADPLVPRP